MSNKKTMEIDISATGVAPRKLAEDAAAVLEGNGRAEVAFMSDRVTLRSVWEVDADSAIFQIQKELKTDIKTSPPRVIYIDEPRALEPIMKLRITVLEDYMGDVMADLNRRRGLVGGLEDVAERGKMIVYKVPLAELFGYASDLGRLSNATGAVEVDFDSYQPAPQNPDPDEPWSVALRA